MTDYRKKRTACLKRDKCLKKTGNARQRCILACSKSAAKKSKERGKPARWNSPVCGTWRPRGGKLTAADKRRLPKRAFGLPERRAYPMPDTAHAKNAKSRATQQLDRGNLSRRDYDRVISKANRIIRACRR